MLAREGAELSATESIRVAQDQAGSLATLVPRYSHAAQILADARYRQTAMDVLGADTGQLLASEWPGVRSSVPSMTPKPPAGGLSSCWPRLSTSANSPPRGAWPR